MDDRENDKYKVCVSVCVCVCVCAWEKKRERKINVCVCVFLSMSKVSCWMILSLQANYNNMCCPDWPQFSTHTHFRWTYGTVCAFVLNFNHPNTLKSMFPPPLSVIDANEATV